MNEPAMPTTRQELDQLLRDEDGVLALCTEGGCSVAEAVGPKVEALISQHFPRLRHVVLSRDTAPELLAQLGVFVFPTLIAWFGGRESARFVRTFSLDVVAETLARPYGLLFGP